MSTVARPPTLEPDAPEPDGEDERHPAEDKAEGLVMPLSDDVERRPHSIIQSFNYAFEGVVAVLRRERNMRIHFAIAAVVLALAVVFDVTRLELIALILVIGFVLMTEMINTALEAAVDVATARFSPLAKIAKDVSAGAVLIASITAVAIGYLVFVEHITGPSQRLITRVRDAPVNPTIGALVLTIFVVIAIKAISGRGTPLRGGIPSGHAALAFAGWIAITFIAADFEHRLLVSIIGLIMAILVAQTRVESGIHSTFEVVVGALVGSLVSLLIFQVLT
jgi:diacylglycerol kinase (ATP)